MGGAAVWLRKTSITKQVWRMMKMSEKILPRSIIMPRDPMLF
jgi:hypothetical protein